MSDRVGIGWRPELAAGILANLDRIEALEVIIEEWADAPAIELRQLRTLGRQAPLLLHGVSLGLASTVPVERRRLDAVARLVEAVRPEAWSEHLAFVRGGGVEIGHLAAPPRAPASVCGARENIREAARVVGMPPAVENVATLIDPPGSTMDEPAWIGGVIECGPAGLLLDLHNLHANAVNFGHDAHDLLARLPLGRVSYVHIAGGRWIGRLLDDHLHPVPDPVWELLEELAARVPGPLTVILERDGAYPAMPVLLAELDRARVALRSGRTRAAAGAA